MRNAENVLQFEIPRRARTSPRLKHATQKPTLLRQKFSALIGSGIEAAPEPELPRNANLIAAGGALDFLLLVCAALLHGG